MELIIILLLILANGIFAMSEIAVITAKKSRLQKKARSGNSRAQTALNLAQSPGRFLSTVQIGITTIGITAGAFGGHTLAQNLSRLLDRFPLFASHSYGLSLFFIIVLITYLSLVLGELVPKRLALTHPEKISQFTAPLMAFLSRLASPLVSLLSASTDLIIFLLPLKPPVRPTVSPEDVQSLLHEGARTGVFPLAQTDILERAINLTHKSAKLLMVPQKNIVWLDHSFSPDQIKAHIAKSPRSHYPVCQDGLDHILGVIRTEDLLTQLLSSRHFDLNKHLLKPLYVPPTTDGLKILELFKRTGIHLAFVVDEYGNLQGLLTLTDVLEAIVGDLPDFDELEDQSITPRPNGSYLIDGLVSLDDFARRFPSINLSTSPPIPVHTVAGLVMHGLNKIPVSGDTLDLDGYRFEVVDMDGHRIDKLLLSPPKTSNH